MFTDSINIKGRGNASWNFEKNPFKKKLLPRESEEPTSNLQSHSEISYAVFCLKKKKK